MQFADQHHRTTLFHAWATAMLHRTKDFPKRADILWATGERAKQIEEDDNLEKTRNSMEWLRATIDADTTRPNRTIMRAEK